MCAHSVASIACVRVQQTKDAQQKAESIAAEAQQQLTGTVQHTSSVTVVPVMLTYTSFRFAKGNVVLSSSEPLFQAHCPTNDT